MTGTSTQAVTATNSPISGAVTRPTYGHVIDELDELPRVSAEDAIRAGATHLVCPWCVRRGGERGCRLGRRSLRSTA